MAAAHRYSKIGDTVTVTDPHSGKKVTGIVDWVSPTKGTVQIALHEGGYAYEYPEWEPGKTKVAIRPPFSKSAGANFALKPSVDKALDGEVSIDSIDIDSIDNVGSIESLDSIDGPSIESLGA